MGCLFSKDLAYSVLRRSVVGALLNDSDFDVFYSICKNETHTLSTNIHLTSSHLFFVVISGEVIATITSIDGKSTIAAIFGPGEMIHLFGSSVSVQNDGSLLCGGIKLSFSSRSTNGTAKLIGADRSTVEEFLLNRPHLTRLKALMNIDMSRFLTGRDSTYLHALTDSQLQLLGPLLKIRLVNEGELIKRVDATNVGVSSASLSTPMMALHMLNSTKGTKTSFSAGSPRSVESQRRRGGENESMSNYMKSAEKANHRYSPVALVLYGSCETVHVELAAPVAERRGSMFSPLTGRGSGKKSLTENLRESIGFVNKVHHMDGGEGEESTAPADTSLKRQVYYPGALVGLEHYLIKKPHLGLHNVAALEFGIVAHLDVSMLQAVTAVDKRFHRVVARNYIKVLLDGVRDMVPMLSDMDETSYTMLASLITVKSYAPEEVIYCRGADSNHIFIVVKGSIKETMEVIGTHPSLATAVSPSIMVTEPSASNPDMSVLRRHLGYGSLFGEVSLITDSPYVSTTVALEPTIVIAISKTVFDDIYNNNKASFAEIRIRMAGEDIGLQHIINHPVGFKLFHSFVESNRAAENLMFYYSAEKFDDMCLRLKKQMNELRSPSHDHQLVGMNSSLLLTTENSMHFADLKGSLEEARHLSTLDSVLEVDSRAPSNQNSVKDSVESLSPYTPHPTKSSFNGRILVDNAVSNSVTRSAQDDMASVEEEAAIIAVVSAAVEKETQRALVRQQSNSKLSATQQQAPPIRISYDTRGGSFNSLLQPSEFGTTNGDETTVDVATPNGNANKRLNAINEDQSAKFPYKLTSQPSTMIAMLPDEDDCLLFEDEQSRDFRDSHSSNTHKSGGNSNGAKKISPTNRKPGGGILETLGRQLSLSSLSLHGKGTTADDKNAEKKPLSSSNNNSSNINNSNNKNNKTQNKYLPQDSSSPTTPLLTTPSSATNNTNSNFNSGLSSPNITTSAKNMKQIPAAQGLSPLRIDNSPFDTDQQKSVLAVGHSGITSTGSTTTTAVGNSNTNHTVSGSKVVKAKLHKIEKTVLELQEVARSIMERYIHRGAEFQINIPDKMRKNTEKLFTEWVKSFVRTGSSLTAINSSASSKLSPINEAKIRPGLSVSTSSVPMTVESSSISLSAGRNTAATRRSVANLPSFQLDFCAMFVEPKDEIFKLLKEDLFVRWKKTRDFHQFISSMKPYEQGHSKSELSSHSNDSFSAGGLKKKTPRGPITSPSGSNLFRKYSLVGPQKPAAVVESRATTPRGSTTSSVVVHPVKSKPKAGLRRWW